jgi:hypothetical protein
MYQQTMPKLPSLASFALAIACFFLPFITVSCSAFDKPPARTTSFNRSTTISGIQLATGQIPATVGFPDIPEIREIKRRGQPSMDRKPEIFAIIPLGAGILGLATNFLNPLNVVIPAIAGITGVVSLLILKNRIDTEVAKYLNLVEVRYEYGFWLALLCFGVALVLNFYELSSKPRRR